MLQNRCKGTDFSPNNQKKTQKKSQTCDIFLIWIDYGMQKCPLSLLKYANIGNF